MKRENDKTGAGIEAIDRTLPPPTPQSAGRIVYAPLTVAQAAGLHERGCAMKSVVIVWRDPHGEAAELTHWLYRIAGLGAWNHLELPNCGALTGQLTRYAQANPNIIHSYCHFESGGAAAEQQCQFPQGHAAYGRTRALPGRPLWQALRDPVRLQACLDQWGAARLMRTHILDDPPRLYQVGGRLEYRFARPETLPPGYLDEICAMVEAGGSVQSQYVRHNLERAFLIACVTENAILVGNSSLKHPRPEYIEAVSRQSGIDLTDYLERGYTSVRPEYRGLGIGAQLLAGLTERAGEHAIFSVIAEGNVATQKMAIRNRTRRVATFYSSRAGKEVGIWIPEWMVPPGVTLPPQPDVT